MITCEDCLIRKRYAKYFDAHFDWRDCPYACEYAKEQVKEETKGTKIGDSISRQVAIAALGERPVVWNEWADEYSLGQQNQYDADLLAIETVPAIDPAKHGKWIKMSDADGDYWACSECGEDLPRVSHFNQQFDLFPRIESIDRTNYCPKCGVRMDGERNEDPSHPFADSVMMGERSDE